MGLWIPNEAPLVHVDAVLSMHAHFDHDAIDKPRADMVLVRMAGTFTLGDVTITGWADKHRCRRRAGIAGPTPSPKAGQMRARRASRCT